MMMNRESWYTRVYHKGQSANFERSQNRYKLLKNNAENIYPRLQLSEDKECWTVKQKISKQKYKYMFFSDIQLRKIGQKIDEINILKIHHGDLCFSNIGFDQDENVLLFDWEINLEIRDNNNLILRTTPYCLHPLDKVTNNITKLTDRFSIAALTMISCHNPSWRSNLTV